MSAGKYFIDTNMFVYLLDPDAAGKKTKAKKIIDQALNKGDGIISYQVVQEFLHVATRKFEKPLTIHEAQNWLETILAPLCEVFPSIDFYKQALVLKQEIGSSIYDALIIQAAVQEKCSILYSEDLQHGRIVSGVKIQNPFL